jgi:flagellar biosynthetic protein FliR
MLSVGLALALVPQARAHAPDPQAVTVVFALVQQVMIGAALGFGTRIVFGAVEAAGALIDLFGGFSLSASYSPLTATTTSIFGQFYSLLTTVLIFATDAHLLIFQGFLRTFASVPLDASLAPNALAAELPHAVTQLFVSALQIAGPLLVVLFIADIGLGVLNRIAPQLNAFSLSFPLKITLTLLLAGLGMTLFPQLITRLAEGANDLVAQVTG